MLTLATGAAARHHGAEPSHVAGAAVVMVGGVGGGWDTPAGGLYERLAEELPAVGVEAMRVRFRMPARLPACVEDVVAALEHLADHGIRRFGLVGHSMGGAVVAQAAAQSGHADALVLLATQAYGADVVAQLPPQTRVLLMHGGRDEVLPAECSVFVHRLARGPKRLLLLEGAGHGLDEAADEVHRETLSFLLDALR